VNSRVSAGAWFLLALVLLSTFAYELRGEVRGSVLFMAAALGISSGWIGYRLWRRPSRVSVVVSICLGGFLLLLVVVAVLQGAVGSPPWGILIPAVLAALASLLPLTSWDRLA
jgi:RsiW-degrading membrane proteinase PrsW (M82 family)